MSSVHVGLHYQEQTERSNYSSLLNDYEAASGRLCSILGFPSEREVIKLERVQRRASEMVWRWNIQQTRNRLSNLVLFTLEKSWGKGSRSRILIAVFHCLMR